METWDELDGGGNPTGRLIERGQPMAEGSFHLVVHVWLTDGNGRFLISERAPGKVFEGMWETPGGSVLSGETSLDGAVREVGEELGVRLDPAKGRLLKRIHRRGANDHTDVWLFIGYVPVGQLVLQAEEVTRAGWATKAEILEMIDKGGFLGRDVFPYIDELFASVD